MKKYKKWWITLGVLLVLCLIGYLFLSVVPRHKANEAVDDYLAAHKLRRGLSRRIGRREDTILR